MLDTRQPISPAHTTGRLPRILLSCALVNAVGTGAFLSGSAAFLVRYLGMSAGQVGVGASVTGTAALLAGVPLGRLLDRLGARRGWLIAVGVQGVMFLCYPFIPGFAPYLAVTACRGAAVAMSDTAEAKYIGDMVEDGARVRASALLRSIHNAGMAAGTALTGVALVMDSAGGYIALAWLNAASFLIVGTLMYLRLPEPTGQTSGTRAVASPGMSRFGALRDPRMLVLSLLNGAIMLYVPLLLVVLPLWILERTDAPEVTVAGALILNMLLSVSLQVMASGRAENAAGAASAQRLAGVLLAAACLLLAATQLTRGPLTVVVLVAGLVALTGGELLASAAAWGLSYAFAPPDRRAEYTAVFRTGSQLAAIAGPAVLVPLIVQADRPGWIGLAVVFAGTGLAAMPIVRWATGRRP